MSRITECDDWGREGASNSDYFDGALLAVGFQYGAPTGISPTSGRPILRYASPRGMQAQVACRPRFPKWVVSRDDGRVDLVDPRFIRDHFEELSLNADGADRASTASPRECGGRNRRWPEPKPAGAPRTAASSPVARHQERDRRAGRMEWPADK
jgi:hypothetical protein